MEFKNEAGLTEKDMNEALSEISKRLDQMNTSGNQLAKQLVNEIMENMDLAVKNIAATYAAGSFDAEISEQEGGQ